MEQKRAKSALRHACFLRKKEQQELHAGMILRNKALESLGIKIIEEERAHDLLADISGEYAPASIECYPECIWSDEDESPHHMETPPVHKATIVIRPEDIAAQLQRAQQAKAAIKMENESILRARAAASARRARTILLKSLGQ